MDTKNSQPDEIVTPAQPIEVHIPDAEPDSKPIDGTVTAEPDLETEAYPESADIPEQIDDPDQPNGGES